MSRGRMQLWERTMRANVRSLTPEQAREVIYRINARGITIVQPEIQALTGGFNSQNINFTTMRALGHRAGILAKP